MENNRTSTSDTDTDANHPIKLEPGAPPVLEAPPPQSEASSLPTAVSFSQPAHVMQPFTRPIRFVSNDGQPHAKRRRISAACKTCRKRKTRCSGEKPTCETCRQNGHICLGYSDNPAGQATATSPPDTVATTSTPTQPVQPDVDPYGGKDNSLGHATAAQNASSPSRKRSAPHTEPGLSTQDSPQMTPSTGMTNIPVEGYQAASVRPAAMMEMENIRPKATSVSELADENPSPAMRYNSPPTTQRLAHRMPYFRYFGPTAIVPGYKQMVVKVKGNPSRPRHPSHSISANSCSTGASPVSTFGYQGAVTPSTSSNSQNPFSGSLPEEIPFYDPNDPAPNNPLIAHLVDIFFTHLGCNFPFLRREAFTRDVEEKRVDAILVDAVCALSARFSNHPLLRMASQQGGASHSGPGNDHSATAEPPKSEYGTVFANRAKSQVVDTFTCPNLAAVQACIILAYTEFGSNRDSGLWMFLGIAIRMAQDLGLQKLEGVGGGGGGRSRERKRAAGSKSAGSRSRRGSGNDVAHPDQGIHENGNAGGTEACRNEDGVDEEELKESKAREQERVDTFWAVFFLDRVIASGTGRPVSIRDKEVELTMPSIEEVDEESGYPPPFPALIRIIQLYGRVTDLLNGIKNVNSVTSETMRRLSGMETDLTKIYQRLSPKLHFNTANFQHYFKTNQSAVFLLLHFWFHTLIVLLHQPTLLIAFEGRIQQLFPNSRELSISSAKTIADILAFAELIDSKAVNGNPFTSQPIYIAACAFLQESATHTASNPTSRNSSPAPSVSLPPFNSMGAGSTDSNASNTSRPPTTGRRSSVGSSNDDIPGDTSPMKIGEGSLTQKISAKHALLATAAHQNYQGCYKALKSLEVYWEGVKYILTVMDQKAKGIVDPLLYTDEEMESVEVYRWGPGIWNRFHRNSGITKEPCPESPEVMKNEILNSTGQLPTGAAPKKVGTNPEVAHSPLMTGIHGDPSQAIGWSLTGITNSPNSNLTFLFQANNNDQTNHPCTAPQSQGTPIMSQITPAVGIRSIHNTSSGMMEPPMHIPSHVKTSGLPQYGNIPQETMSDDMDKYSIANTPTSDAEMLLGLSNTHDLASMSHSHPAPPSLGNDKPLPLRSIPLSPNIVMTEGGNSGEVNLNMAEYGDTFLGDSIFGQGYEIMLESEDVNMNTLGLDVVPWLEYLPHDVVGFYEGGAGEGEARVDGME